MPGGGQPRARSLLAYQAVELVWSGDWHTRVALSDEAVAMARRLGDPETLTLVLHLRFMTLWAASTLVERLAIVGEAQALASRLDDRTLAFHAASRLLLPERRPERRTPVRVAQAT